MNEIVTIEKVQALIDQINSVSLNREKYISQLKLWLSTPECFADELTKTWCQQFFNDWLK